MNPDQLRDASLLELFALEADAQADTQRIATSTNIGLLPELLLPPERDDIGHVLPRVSTRCAATHFAQGPHATSNLGL